VPVALLADLELSEQVSDLVLAEAREGEVDIRHSLQVRDQTCEELFVPGAGDLVEREPEEARLFHGDVEPRHWHAREAQPAGRDQPLVTTDNRSVLAAGEHRLDEAELAKATLKSVELLLADPARVGGIRSELIDRNELDGDGR
jgi:hypothetical protein